MGGELAAIDIWSETIKARRRTIQPETARACDPVQPQTIRQALSPHPKLSGLLAAKSRERTRRGVRSGLHDFCSAVVHLFDFVVRRHTSLRSPAVEAPSSDASRHKHEKEGRQKKLKSGRGYKGRFMRAGRVLLLACLASVCPEVIPERAPV